MIHGFNGSPNGSWMPWLMSELKVRDIYGCALYMPNPGQPQCDEWVSEIARIISQNTQDEIYLTGHSLGVAAVLKYFQSSLFVEPNPIKGGVLVAGRSQPSENKLTENFYNSFDFSLINTRLKNFIIIHGDQDPIVSVEHAYKLGEKLEISPLIISGGGHFSRTDGYAEFPKVLEELLKIMK